MGARTAGGRPWASWTNTVVRAGRMGMSKLAWRLVGHRSPMIAVCSL
ncbi:hypothetical protein [Streptomyces sp. NPDC014623]